MRLRRAVLALATLGVLLVLIAPLIVAGESPRAVDVVDLRSPTEPPVVDVPVEPASQPPTIVEVPAQLPIGRDSVDDVEGDDRGRDDADDDRAEPTGPPVDEGIEADDDASGPRAHPVDPDDAGQPADDEDPEPAESDDDDAESDAHDA